MTCDPASACDRHPVRPRHPVPREELDLSPSSALPTPGVATSSGPTQRQVRRNRTLVLPKPTCQVPDSTSDSAAREVLTAAQFTASGRNVLADSAGARNARLATGRALFQPNAA